jgi:hypothetical protein
MTPESRSAEAALPVTAQNTKVNSKRTKHFIHNKLQPPLFSIAQKISVG